MNAQPAQKKSDPDTHEFYRRGLEILIENNVAFLVGGAFAFRVYTGIHRDTKDLDIFVKPKDLDMVLKVLGSLGHETEITHPQWLGKAFSNGNYIDVIFSSANTISEVDDGWFEHSTEDTVYGMKVRLCPVEEMIWSKAFVMERERYDGADIAHLLRASAGKLDWTRLLARFGTQWHVLLSNLILFSFIYPGERNQIPAEVMHELLGRFEREMKTPRPAEQVCNGTLISASQYEIDVAEWGYTDGRELIKLKKAA